MSNCEHFPRFPLHLSPHPHLTNNVQGQQQQPLQHIFEGALLIMQQLPTSSFYANYSLFFPGAVGYPTCMHTSKLQHNYISHKKTSKSYPLQFLEQTKNITDQRFVSQNPDHKPRDPGHSSNTFCLDSLWPYTSHPLYRFQPRVTGESPKIQHQ